MHTIVFVPGIMGSRLKLTQSGEEIWPPTIWEVSQGYGRLDQLLDRQVEANGIILSVAGGCYDVYQPLVDDLNECVRQGGTDEPRRLDLFAYDWRLDLFDLADQLAARLRTLAADSTTITLIGHSMGGLICRLVLENAAYHGLSWHGRIGQFLALAVPHRGAPLALARVLGLDSALGITATDFKKLAADPRYPSGYQLLPWRGDAVMWERNPVSKVPLKPIDFYDRLESSSLGLNPVNLTRALAVQQVLSAGHRPAQVRYLSFSGTRYQTVARVDRLQNRSLEKVTVADGGDGTVPSWSGLLLDSQHQYAGTDHQNIFTDEELRRTLFRVLGAFLPFVAFGVDSVDGSPAELRLNLPNPVIRLDQPSLALQVILLPKTTTIKGKLVLESDPTAGVGTQTPSFTPVTDYPLSFDGPEVETLSITLPTPGTAGLYRLRFEGEPSVSKPLMFAIQA